MPEHTAEDAMEWFVRSRPVFESLTDIARSVVETLIKNAGIEYFSVTGRTKTVESFKEKINRKQYSSPQQEITDYCGIRVITYIETDVGKVLDVLRSTLFLHEDKIPERQLILPIDRVGYRSEHLVCDLGQGRLALPEYTKFAGLLFEIQVRTVLQHAWAEIEHDRSYKFAGVLPAELRRRMYLLSGTLELVDREFAALAKEIDEYSSDVTRRARAGDLEIELDSASLMAYLSTVAQKFKLSLSGPGTEARPWMIYLLERLGVHTLADLDAYITDEVIKIYSSSYGPVGIFLLLFAILWQDAPRVIERGVALALPAYNLPLLLKKYEGTPTGDLLQKRIMWVTGDEAPSSDTSSDARGHRPKARSNSSRRKKT